MKATKIYDITFETNETIMAATLSKVNEVVMLMSSGNVIRFSLDNQTGEHLFSVRSVFSYGDGGFDITAKTSIYTMDEVVVVVNDFKTHGFVHYPGKYQSLHLWRKDYHADISTYPIALYKNENQVPHLIFAEDWNHIQIMNLDTRQILTASKSLIEASAEEQHIESAKHFDEPNKLAWPRPYDYFFGKLLLSPDQSKFLSTGWAWGSCDCYNVYDIEIFINSNRISGILVGAWEHESRGACWIDNETIALLYDPLTEGDEDSTVDTPGEIHYYKITDEGAILAKKIQLPDKSILKSTIYFEKELNVIIAISDVYGLTAISRDGKTVFTDMSIKAKEYSVDFGCFIATGSKDISVYKITE